jgi:hypothetical protein
MNSKEKKTGALLRKGKLGRKEMNNFLLFSSTAKRQKKRFLGNLSESLNDELFLQKRKGGSNIPSWFFFVE